MTPEDHGQATEPTVIARNDVAARLLRHRTVELEEYKRAALSRDMSPEFVAEFESLKQQLARAVGLLRDAHDRDRIDGSMPSIDWYKRVDAYLNPQTPGERGR